MQRTPIAYSTSYRQPLAGSLALAAAVALLVLVLAACSSSSNIGGNGDSGSADALGGDVVVDAPGDVATDGCLPTFTDCEDLCGPVRDRCTGEFHPCGPCIVGGLVCDLETNSCVEPLDDCKELNAECGEIRNSCGGWVKNGCGYCPADKECDPDTNTCVDCKNVTCIDMGFECGQAWLGCGGQVTDKTDCGPCDNPDETCNEALHICEPKACSGKTDAELCAEAKAQRGVECGSITNGCGAMIDCNAHLDPCPEGTSCGVLGVGNRCDPPPVANECLALGVDCNYKGQLKSKCTDGQGNPVTLYCGECTAPDVCNPNNRCGPRCEPTTCDDLEEKQCGTQLDDGCAGTLKCGCDAGTKCSTSEIGKLGTCLDKLTCEDYTDGYADRALIEGKACSTGNAFDDGTGTDTLFRCRCKSGLLCIDEDSKVVSGANKGTCCKNENPTCSGENGPCRVTNSCTGASSNCCRGTLYCDNGSTCKERLTCDYYQNGKDPIPCSNTPIAYFKPIPGETEEMACPCPSGQNLYCVDSNTSDELPGECCEFDAAAACAVIGNREGQCQVRNSCTGALVNCCNLNTHYCDPATQRCIDREDCEEIVGYADRQIPEDHQCSLGPAFDDGSGDRLIMCRCLSGLDCIDTASPPGAYVSGAEIGNCCANSGPSCSGAGGPCTVSNSCLAGSSTNCCTGTLFCNSSNVCEETRRCSYYSATGAVGSPCGTFDDGAGGTIPCPCSTSGGYANNRCVGGTCVCSPSTCNNDCRRDNLSNGCGGRLDCECTSPQVCNPTDGLCCTQPTCPPGGVLRDKQCRFTNCGVPKVCPCANQYDTCGGGETATTCGCTPTITSCNGQVGDDIFDDCGNKLDCDG